MSEHDGRTTSHWRILQRSVGQEIHCSDWLRSRRSASTRFAAATGDHQWIHVDPVRAARESP